MREQADTPISRNRPFHAMSRAGIDQRGLERLAELLALKIRPGWIIALRGDLGAGKSTFARALIRAVLGDSNAEVPSPTFSLVQSYTAGRVPLHHYDLYRLSGSGELIELGIEEAVAAGAALIEWPDRVGESLGQPRLDISISETPDDPDKRDILFEAGAPQIAAALERIDAMDTALDQYLASCPAELDRVAIRYLQGDASPRGYARVSTVNGSVMLMDSPAMPDGPPVRGGLPYSRVAHLAEDVRPFIAVGEALRAAGLSAPEIYTADLDRGVLVLEDLGDRVFGREITSIADPAKRDVRMRQLWSAAAGGLAALRIANPSPSIVTRHGLRHELPAFDTGALAIETELLVDWYWPAVFGEPVPEHVRLSFQQAWAPVFGLLTSLPSGWVLRDFHSPNLIWLPERSGVERVGVIDFQDAMQGHWAYDVVSLFQDARIEVPREIERELFDAYCSLISAATPSFDRKEMERAYTAFGAQRATKVIGIFARLALRDGKPGYLQHIPRLWRTLERNLESADLVTVRSWFDGHIPGEMRAKVPFAGR